MSALSFGVRDEVLEVELHGPPLNVIGLPMLAELEEVAAFIRHGADGARAVVFSSGLEGGFSAGADLKELHAGLAGVESGDVSIREKLRTLFGGVVDGPRTARAAILRSTNVRRLRDLKETIKVWGVRAFLDRVHRVFNTFDEAPIPTVAAVHGVCFGGGFELALTCDVIVADKSARFSFPELRLGLIPGFGGIPRLERDLGNAVIRDLLLSGRSIGARRAYEVGLIAHLVGDGHAPKVARRLASQMKRLDPATSATAKRFIKPSVRVRLDQEKALFCELLTSPAVKAELERFIASDDDPFSYLPDSNAKNPNSKNQVQP